MAISCSGMEKTDPREQILQAYSRWTALSALRSGAPIKSRADITRVMSDDLFVPLVDASNGQVTGKEFDAWHEATCHRMVELEQRLGFGWAAKLINVYLKTYSYVGGGGRPGLAAVLHPPIDGMLWRGLRSRFRDSPEILQLTNCVERINKINDYACYRRIIQGCRRAAAALNCTLFEVEQLWSSDGTHDPGKPDGVGASA